MDIDRSRLDGAMADANVDGHLLDAGAASADQRYLSGFDAEDPFVTLYTGEETVLLVSSMEYGRAQDESRATAIRRYAAYDRQSLVDEYGPSEGRARAIAAFLEDFDVEAVSTNQRFPLQTADVLRDVGITVKPDETDAVGRIRASKTPEEVADVRAAQRANERAMRAAEAMLADADVVDGVLEYDGAPLTSERVRHAIEATLLEDGCGLDETIVASGQASATPHDRGSGQIHADEPVIVDIFPRDKTTRYHSDMTRTFVRGEASETIAEFHDLTRRAKRAALDAVEPGATGADVHDAVCDVYEDAGYPTLRSDETTDRGFVHSTGHGVGLEVHERPHISRNGEELEPGHVITIEPGLYDPDVGGVRIEDIVVVTDDGYENLTDYHERLEI